MPWPIRVEAFLLDDVNEGKFASHQLTGDQVLQTLDGPRYIRRNHGATNAPYLFIGHDYNGACIAIPIDPTDEPTVWRHRTAWRGKRGEATALAAHGEEEHEQEE